MSASALRLVAVTQEVPYTGIVHAGGRYLVEWHAVARATTAHLSVCAPDTPTNREALTQPGAPATVWLLGPVRKGALAQRATNWWHAQRDAAARRQDPGAVSAPFERALRRSGPAREAVAEADVIDVQWFEMIRTTPLLRSLNPHARIVGTFHDVHSQLFARFAATASPAEAARWHRAAELARTAERRALAQLDVAVVFSDKDAELLADGVHDHKIVVVPPPLATGNEVPRADLPAEEVVVMVANYSRTPNQQGVHWLVDEVWPLVVAARPAARLRLVGAGMSDELARAFRARGIEVTGQVDDLAPHYAQARVAAIPLHQGAGVKFKTLEALLADVPVVTTSVGAEGIAGAERFAALEDSAEGFARGVIETLAAPEQAQRQSAVSQAWARATYGTPAFAQRLHAIWTAR